MITVLMDAEFFFMFLGSANGSPMATNVLVLLLGLLLSDFQCTKIFHFATDRN